MDQVISYGMFMGGNLYNHIEQNMTLTLNMLCTKGHDGSVVLSMIMMMLV